MIRLATRDNWNQAELQAVWIFTERKPRARSQAHARRNSYLNEAASRAPVGVQLQWGKFHFNWQRDVLMWDEFIRG